MVGRGIQPNQFGNWLSNTVITAPVTTALVIINLVFFILLTISGGAENSANLYRWGAKFGPAIQAGDWHRLLLPIFLHAGFLHLAANTFALIMFGPRLERDFGWLAYSATYVVSGVGGVAASYLVSPTLSVGASGAVFGLVGAYGVLLFRSRKEFGSAVNPILINLGIIIAVNVIFGALWPGIDQGAHIGGMIAGAAMGFFVAPRFVIHIEDDFLAYGQPIVRTYIAKASTQRIAAATAVGLLIAAAISWWVTTNVSYDAGAMQMYGYLELVTS